MKRFLLFILPILIVVAVVMTVFGFFQVRYEEEKLMDELRRKASSVAESMDLSVQEILLTQSIRNAAYIVEKFEARERLQGCVIYDTQGQIFAVTRRFTDWEPKEKTRVEAMFTNREPHGGLVRFKEMTLYSYLYPVFSQDGKPLGLIEIVYDTSYFLSRLAEVWRHISITLFCLVTVIIAIALVIQWRIFILPVRQLTEWFHLFQKGETEALQPIKTRDELGKLAMEVEQVALSLRVARRSVSQEAQERLHKGETWTEAKLRDLVRAKMGEDALFVVSNREPYMHVMDEGSGTVKCIRPASGVVTALHPVLCACGGIWVAHGSGNADRKFVNSRDKLGVPPKDNRYILKRVWLTKEEEEGYYFGFSNEGIWPLCHMTHTRPVFRDSDWQMYVRVNQKFAQSLLDELPAQSPFVFIQDYHFMLLPRMIKEKRPDATVALFWHIPWPNAEVISICPYQKEILEGMLGCDLIGFHVQNHCNNFLDTANRLLESRIDMERFSVVRAGKETFVRPFPISVGMPVPQADDAKMVEAIRREYDLEGKIVALGVERIDYTKGLIERMLAIDRFLEKNPQYKGKFVFIQLAAPSRTHIKRYHELISELDEIVEKKNWKYFDGVWKPIIYLKRHFSQDEIRPFFLAADICVVSSLDDGMNLVAKEYVAARQDTSGCLVLSRFTGAARELTEAVLMNPYSIEEFSDAIRQAVEMPAEEKTRRMEKLRAVIQENNVYRWAGNIITELTGLKGSGGKVAGP